MSHFTETCKLESENNAMSDVVLSGIWSVLLHNLKIILTLYMFCMLQKCNTNKPSGVGKRCVVYSRETRVRHRTCARVRVYA